MLFCGFSTSAVDLLLKLLSLNLKHFKFEPPVLMLYAHSTAVFKSDSCCHFLHVFLLVGSFGCSTGFSWTPHKADYWYTLLPYILYLVYHHYPGTNKYLQNGSFTGGKLMYRDFMSSTIGAFLLVQPL